MKLRVLLFLAISSCTSSPVSHTSSPLSQPSALRVIDYNPVAVMVCSMSGTDFDNKPAEVTIGPVGTLEKKNDIGISLSYPEISNEYPYVIKVFNSKRYFPASMTTKPTPANCLAIAKEFLKENKLEDDFVVDENLAHAIPGHAWSPEGWRPIPGATPPNYFESQGFALLNKTSGEAFNTSVLVDSKGKPMRVFLHFFVNVQPKK